LYVSYAIIRLEALTDNFRGWSSVDTDGNRINNKTLRERLTEDKHTVHEKPGSILFGSNYDKSIKDSYASSANPAKMLRILDPTMEVGQRLHRALTSLKLANSNKALFAASLTHTHPAALSIPPEH
jgi:hypothetical protein